MKISVEVQIEVQMPFGGKTQIFSEASLLGTRRNTQSFMYQNNFCIINKQYKIKKSRMKSKFII